MNHSVQTDCVAFERSTLLAFGHLGQVARAVKRALDEDQTLQILIFDAETSQPIELDLRGSIADVVGRISENEGEAPRGPGRPKLGVTAREVTLLPRHWDWLASQPGGASVTLRKLVEDARRVNESADRLREGQASIHRFMIAVAGNAPHFDEALRALFAGDKEAFLKRIAAWPHDVEAHLRKLSDAAF
jgi:hypothetical protein